MRAFAAKLNLFGWARCLTLPWACATAIFKIQLDSLIVSCAWWSSWTGAPASLFQSTGSLCHHITVAKIDAEGDLVGPIGLGSLRESGILSVDQVNVEVHVRQSAKGGGLRIVHDLFAGVARCGMVFHSKEINFYGCYFGGCAEYGKVRCAWRGGQSRLALRRGRHAFQLAIVKNVDGASCRHMCRYAM